MQNLKNDLRITEATLTWLASQFRDRANDDGEESSKHDADQVDFALKTVRAAIEAAQ